MTNPEEQGKASEERERIVKFLQSGADYWAKQAKEAWHDADWDAREDRANLLRAAAREIRDDAHHEGEQT